MKNRERNFVGEVRSFGGATVQRAVPQISEDGRTLTGYAIVFNQESRVMYSYMDGYFREVILPEAVTKEFLDKQDIKLNFNHDDNRLLARSVNGVGTLRYEVDEFGVRFTAEVADNTAGRDVVESVRRGDLQGCSFRFVDNPGKVEVTYDEDGIARRTVGGFSSIQDFAVVVDPAYMGTSIEARSFQRDADPEVRPEETPAPEAPAATEETESAENSRETEETPVEQANPQSEGENAPEGEESGENEERNINNNSENMTQMEIQAAERARAAELNTAFRGLVQSALEGRRAINIASVAADQPLSIADVIMPLNSGDIIGQIGARIQYGLQGAWNFPTMAPLTASINGENVEVTGSDIDFAKVSPAPKRTALVIKVSKSAYAQTAADLREICLTQLRNGVRRLLNQWLFSKTAISSGCEGPFVNAKTKKTGELSYENIISLRAAVLATGVEASGVGAYVVNPATYGVLESTSKDTGSGRFVIEDGKINGVPVYASVHVPADAVEFGFFEYALLGQFGEANIVVDPYSSAASNYDNYVLNADWDVKPLCSEAFGILTKEG